MIKTGELLKKEREKQRIAIEDVAITTRINLKILLAIESGDLKSLPAPPFIRGFVKSYAKFLKIDEAMVLNSFHEEMGSTKPTTNPSSEGPVEDSTAQTGAATVGTGGGTPTGSLGRTNKENKTSDQIRPTERVSKEHLKTNNTFKIAVFSIVTVILLVLIFTTIKVVEKYDREAQVVSDSGSTEELKTEEAGNSEVTSTDDADVAPADSSNTSALVIATDTSSTTSTTATTTTLPTPTSTTTVTVTSLTSQTTKTTVPKMFDLVIESLDNITVEYRVDDGGLTSKKMKPDEVLNIRAKKNLNVDFSDGGAVNVIFNGKDLGQPGVLGKPHKMKFP
jgi:cytoskeleton protein RodZ